MKKVMVYLFSIFAFLFMFTTKVDASQYQGVLGYDYSLNSTIFYFYIEDENVDKIYLYVDEESKGNLTYDDSGIYVINVPGDLKDKEYYYKVCYKDSTCVDTYDPFATTLSSNKDKNIVLDRGTLSVEGWNGVSNVNNSYDNNLIYAIEADKFVENINISSDGGNVNNSVFAKLIAPATYQSSGNISSQSIDVGFKYLVSLGITHLEVGNLYDSSNYFYPNVDYSSTSEALSTLMDYRNFIVGYKNEKMNIIARTNLLTPSDKLKQSLSILSSDFIKEGKINLTNPMMQRYILDVYSYWVSEYKIDGFYIEDANLYGEEYLNELITSLKDINSDLFIYADNSTEYKVSDKLQETLFGSLLNSNNEGIINGDFSENNFNTLVDSMFSGYYSDLSKIEQAKKIINNIGSFSGLDIYSKIKLVSGLGVKESLILSKIRMGYYTIFSSVGIPRVVSGNEFLNTTTIASSEIENTDDSDMICNSSKTFCYAIGDNKKIDWKYLVSNSTELSRMTKYRTRYAHQYPSEYTMKNSTGISYNKETIASGILHLVINYDAEYEGDTERSILIFNYSGNNVELNKISDKSYGSIAPILGKIAANDDSTTIYDYTMFSFTEIKEKKFAEWVYIIIAIVLFAGIFALRAFLIKMLKDKKGIDYNEYVKANKKDKKSKKNKEKKIKEESVFATYLSDDPLLNKKNRQKKEKEDNESNKVEENKDSNNE